jgi:squalene synthase HpnC
MPDLMWDIHRELETYGPHSFAKASLAESREYCRQVTRDNSENFTVASCLLPRHLQSHFHAVYAYCRWADDLADETGTNAPALLTWWRHELEQCFVGHVHHPVFVALRTTIQEFEIPNHLFGDLLTAFEQDQVQKQYATFEDLLAYCRNSANPVGRMVLRLFRSGDVERDLLADEICTGLQLTNFWQDVARDQAIGRRYLPADDMARFGYSVEDWQSKWMTPAFAELLKFEIDRTQAYFDRGRALRPLVPRRLRIDLSLFIRGGESILQAIRRQKYDVWSDRPRVSQASKISILFKTLIGL